MSTLDFMGKKVIDFGTGTGVLAVLAEKMGAEKVIAIDVDDWSIRNAEENIVINNCKAIQLVQAGQMIRTSGLDVILANINFNVIVANLSRLVAAGKVGATLVFSGMLSEDEKGITEYLVANGIIVTHVSNRNNWLLIVGIKH